MLTIFNRKEVFVTYSMKDQADAREILRNNEIQYRVKSSSNRRSRNPLAGVDNVYEYKIYVHKDDWAKAKYLLAQEIKRR